MSPYPFFDFPVFLEFPGIHLPLAAEEVGV